jgi:hypothetical protein
MLGWRLVPAGYLSSLEARVRDLEKQRDALLDRLLRLAAPEPPKPAPVEPNTIEALRIRLSEYERAALEEASRQMSQWKRTPEEEQLLSELGL